MIPPFQEWGKSGPSPGTVENETLIKKNSELFKGKLGKLQQAFDSDISEEELAKNDPYQVAFDQLKESLATVNAFLLIMEVLEILIDALSFKDTLAEDNYFDSGLLAGKGLVNAGFTVYYIVMQYWKPDEDHSIKW